MLNTGQMLMVLGALVLFSLMLPSMNQTMLYNDRMLTLSGVEMTAMSVAQRILAEAGTKVFDEVCLTTQPTTPNQLTAPGQLGSDSGEGYPNFDDLDDYNNLAISDTIAFPSVPFNISAIVQYMDPNNPTQTVGYRTFVKRLQVFVGSPFLINPASEDSIQIVLEQLYSYY